MSKRSRACEFSKKEREEIYERDYGCIFCQKNYRMEPEGEWGHCIFEVMHYVPRSQGGLGIARNAAIGCKYHHMMLDNSEHRAEMKEIFKAYLQRMYWDWNEKDLIYDKTKG